MSPRTVITWAENTEIFGDAGFAFRLTFLNKCDELARPLVGGILSAPFRQGAARERDKCRHELKRAHPPPWDKIFSEPRQKRS